MGSGSRGAGSFKWEPHWRRVNQKAGVWPESHLFLVWDAPLFVAGFQGPAAFRRRQSRPGSPPSGKAGSFGLLAVGCPGQSSAEAAGHTALLVPLCPCRARLRGENQAQAKPAPGEAWWPRPLLPVPLAN